MNVRIVVPSAFCLWAGTTLLLSRMRWFSRRPLAERLAPYRPALNVGERRSSARSNWVSVESFRDVVTPIASDLGGKLARLFGVEEDLGVRLDRIHSSLDPAAFRLRQLGWAIAAFGVAALLSLGLGLLPVVGLALSLGAPLLAFLVIEQRLANASARWQRSLFLELPVTCEQLGMLLSAGFSLGSALGRLAARGNGTTARDLQVVVGRIRQGLSESDALREWAERADVPEVGQAVHVLTLNRATTDLGRLMAQEARSVRREVQRRRIETIERRAQQVWIPVTVATLIPGVIFLAVPFLEAMRIFAGS